MNLFVTGGTGFFGKALLRYWAKKSSKFDKIYILSRKPEEFIFNHRDSLLSQVDVEFIKGDVLNLSELPFNNNADFIIHAATESSKGPTLNKMYLYEQITKGTEEVLKFAAKHNCRKFLLASSGGVYGSQSKWKNGIPETCIGGLNSLNINNAYSIGKISSEFLCALYAQKYDFQFVVMRCFSFIGEDLPLSGHYAIGNFIRDAIARKQIVVQGNGLDIRSYLDQRDLAKWIVTILDEGKNGTVYNVGSNIGITIIDLANLVRDIVSPGKEICVLGHDLSAKVRSYYVPDTSLVKLEMGLSVTVPLDKAIYNTANIVQKKL